MTERTVPVRSAPVHVAEVVADLGHGRPVALLHGVGFGPATLLPVASAVATGARAVLVRRPTARRDDDLERQAAAVAALLEEHLDGEPYVVAGVSGGATLSLALAAETGARLRAVVAHEPLVGSHAPALHGLVRASRDALAGGQATPAAWLRGLVGPAAWDRLDEQRRAAAVAEHADLVREVTPFTAWSPSGAVLARLRALPVTTTIGADSGPARWEAATALRTIAGADVVEVAGGHLVQFDDPTAFAAAASRAVAQP